MANYMPPVGLGTKREPAMISKREEEEERLDQVRIHKPKPQPKFVYREQVVFIDEDGNERIVAGSEDTMSGDSIQGAVERIVNS